MKKIILLTGSSGMVGRNIINHNFSQNYKILSPTSSDLNLLNFESSECLKLKLNFLLNE